MISAGPSITRLATFVNGYPFKPDDLGVEGLPVVRIRHLVDPTVEPETAATPDRAVLIDDGDLVFSWSATLAVRRWWRGPGLLNQHLFRVDPAPDVEVRWLHYVLELGIEYLKPLMHGSAMTHITKEMLASVTVAPVSPERQRAIADFLDAETARIDALIAKREQTLRLVEQRRWAIFASHLRRTKAPVAPLRRGLIAITDGPFGSAFTSSEYSDTGIVVVRLGNIGFAEWRAEPIAHLPSARLAEFDAFRVREGNLLIAGLGDANNHAGRACVAPNLGEAIVKGKCFCAQVDPRFAVADYLAMYCSSPLGADAMAVEARGSTRSMINLDIIKSMDVPLPDTGTQRAIVVTVRNEWLRSASVLNGVARQIGLLRERRQALITAAVTGGLEIPGAAA